MHSHDQTLLAKLGFADPDRRNSRHDLACDYLAQPDIAIKLLAPFITKDNPHVVSIPRDIQRLREGGRCWLSGSSLTIHREYNGICVHRLGTPVSRLERPVSKGEGQYKTTVGFIDVTLQADIHRRFVGKSRREYEQFKNQGETNELGLKVAKVAFDAIGRRTSTIEVPVEKFALNENGVLTCPDLELPGLGYDDQPTRWGKLETETEVVWSEWADADRDLGVLEAACVFVEVKIQPVGVGELLRQINLYREYLPRFPWYAVTAFDMNARELEQLKINRVHHLKLGHGFDKFVTEQGSFTEQKQGVSREI